MQQVFDQPVALDIPRLLERLNARAVRYVLVGSAAALAYGAEEVTPGDLDIVPSLDPANLTRLAVMLTEIDGRKGAGTGHWEQWSDGEWHWADAQGAAQEPSDAKRNELDPHRWTTFDGVFNTRLGPLDVVPQIAGSFERLIQRAVRLEIYGNWALVAHIDEILARLTIPRRQKDVARVRQLREIQFQRGLRDQDL